jgi:two-component system, NarL family, nitrate/nitrite response regulator NarL
MKPIRVLLVDDHDLFRRGLAGLFAGDKEFRVVGEASNGEEALNKAKDLKPDIILMDIYMPGVDGLQATRRIKQDVPKTRIIILTVSEDDKNLFEAIKAGAHGYLLKNVAPEVLEEDLREVFRGEAPIARYTAAKILQEFAAQSRGRQIQSCQENLTVREEEVLNFLTRGLTNKEIGNKLGIAENTVKNHLKNILGKLHLQNRVQAATFAIETGMVAKKDGSDKN